MRSWSTWFGIVTILLSIVLFILPSFSGEGRIVGGKTLESVNEAHSLILLGASMIVFAWHGLRKTGK
jgi:hypothetical protein